jgi:hypothetical protein
MSEAYAHTEHGVKRMLRYFLVDARLPFGLMIFCLTGILHQKSSRQRIEDSFVFQRVRILKDILIGQDPSKIHRHATGNYSGNYIVRKEPLKTPEYNLSALSWTNRYRAKPKVFLEYPLHHQCGVEPNVVRSGPAEILEGYKNGGITQNRYHSFLIGESSIEQQYVGALGQFESEIGDVGTFGSSVGGLFGLFQTVPHGVSHSSQGAFMTLQSKPLQNADADQYESENSKQPVWQLFRRDPVTRRGIFAFFASGILPLPVVP